MKICFTFGRIFVKENLFYDEGKMLDYAAYFLRTLIYSPKHINNIIVLGFLIF